MARTFFSSRHAGNLATHVGDDLEQVRIRREKMKSLLSTSDLVFMEQTHSDQVVEVTADRQAAYEADALFTSVKGVSLSVLTADCIPLLISTSTHVAAVHVGRPGLVNEIAIKTVHAMRNAGASDFTAVMGPSVCGECYEVSPEMYAEVIAQIPATATTAQKHALNLQQGLRFQLESLGVQVSEVARCTKEDGNYFSYRREQSTGRQIGVISL